MFARRATIVAVLVAAAAPFSRPLRAEISSADQKLVQDVFARIVAAATPVEGWAWPPKLNFVDEDEVQAYATVDLQQDPPQPLVFIYRGILEQVIEGDENRLALLLGHELSHITCKHVKPAATEKTPLVEFAATRDEEHEADVEGLKLALAAGYSYQESLGMLHRFIELGQEYTSYEALHADHPSWKQRLAHVDKEQSQLWGATAAFEAGVQFLTVENYIAAAHCFKVVTEDFPECHEAYANLGYAQLMWYCDLLNAKDLARFDIGPLVVGAFYDRPESILPKPDVREVPPEDLWWNAIGALREALRLNPDSVLAAANLGIAYLVGPDGKDVARATKYLDLAEKLSAQDESQPLLARAAILANSGVALLESGDSQSALAKLAEADELQQAFAGAAPKSGISPAITAAILYHRAVVLAATDDPKSRREALDLLEQFLSILSRASLWWSTGYDQYTKLCEQLNMTPKSAEKLAGRRATVYRPAVTVELSDDQQVAVSEPVAEVVARLGEGELLQTIAGTSVRRIKYADQRIALIVAKTVLAICLSDPEGPALALRPAGVATDVVELKVGMSKTDLDQLLGDQQYDYRQLTDPEVNYRFYRQLGIAVRVKQGAVVELIVVQIPERNPS